jgi:nucleoside permease NupC
MIERYALCGFANCASIGLQISVLSTFAPNKAKLLPKIALPAMLAGNITTFLNGKFIFFEI